MNYILLCLSLLIQSAGVKRVIDGDTFVLYQVGLTDELRIRILGVDTPELHGADSVKAQVATAYTQAWLDKGAFTISGCKYDSFGRMLAAVYRGSDTLAVDLINIKLGVPK